MTQAQVAEPVGIDTSFYGQIERGKNIPSIKTLYAIAKALDVDVSELLPRSAKSGAHPYDKAINYLVKGMDAKTKRSALTVLAHLVKTLKK